MQQVLIAAPGSVELRDVPVPRPQEHEVRIRPTRVGICGSDLHGLAGEHPFIQYPYVPGHEVVGVVEEVGSEVAALAPGARVLLEPTLVCGRCAYCKAGRYNLCDELAGVGAQVPGAMAQAFTAPAARFHVVPDTMGDAEAALVEPLATAVHATHVAGELTGRTVAVLGAGTIGLLAVTVARCAGAKRIVVSEPVASKRALASRLGASSAFDARSHDLVRGMRDAVGGQVDIVFDCVASQATIHQAIRLAEKGGRVVVVGVPTGDVTVELPIIQDREIRIEGTATYVARDVLEAIALMRDGRIAADELVTATFSLSEAREAFAVAKSPDSVKVQLVCS
jgi:L-iditol 2-dehydrogenase